MTLAEKIISKLPKEKKQPSTIPMTEPELPFKILGYNQCRKAVKQALQKVEVDEIELAKVLYQKMDDKGRIEVDTTAHAIASNMDKIVKEKK